MCKSTYKLGYFKSGYIAFKVQKDFKCGSTTCNWASEASPTLGCSIEISRDIYIYVGMYVCRGPKSVGGNTWAKRAHAQGQYWAVKSDQ